MADVQSLFPKMQDKRLALIGKQLHRVRKTTSIVNDKLKNKYSRYSRAMDKDKKSYDYKMWQKSMPHKHFYVQTRGTQKCLKKIREENLDEGENSPFGMYNGVTLRELQPKIDAMVKEAHPKTRRLRKADKLLIDGRNDGRIFDNTQAKEKLEAILKRPSFPPRRERGMTLFINSRRPSTSSEWSVDTQEITSASALRLPPITISRENTKEGIVFRPKSKSISHVLPKRSTTFAFDPNTARY